MEVLSKEGQLVLASAVRLCLVGEIVEHEEGQLLFTCRIVNVTSVQSRLSGLCTLLIEVAANIDSIWNMWICGVGDSVDQSAIAQDSMDFAF